MTHITQTNTMLKRLSSFVVNPGVLCDKKLQSAVLFIYIIFSLSACFEPQEGCTDIAATNFDASADKNCADCCTYPKLLLEVVQRYDTVTFLENRAYEASNGQWFILKSASFYLSDFQVFQNGESFMVSDTVGLRTFAPAGSDTLREIFTDDFVLVRRVPLVNEVGTFRTDGVFEKVRFRVGLDADAQRVIPRLAPAGHPLRIQSDSLWHGRAAGFVFAQVIVARDTFPGTIPDTLALTQSELPDFSPEGNGAFVHETGYNFTVTLTVDYKKLLEGIDWTTGDISAWKTRIAANMQGAFSVSQ